MSAIFQVPACVLLLRRCGFLDQGKYLELCKHGLRFGELARVLGALRCRKGPLQDFAAQLSLLGVPEPAGDPEEDLRHSCMQGGPKLPVPGPLLAAGNATPSRGISAREELAALAATHREPEAQRPDRNLRCATQGCPYLVHSNPDMGGYCCIACLEGGSPGPRCERRLAPAGVRTADPNSWPMSGAEMEVKEFNEAIYATSLAAAEQESQALVMSSEDAELEEAIRRSMLDT